MKRLLLALFILTAGFMKPQCSMSTSVTPPSCPGNCDAAVTINLSPGCTAFPYNLVINGGTCTPTGTFVMTSSSITFSNLCGCGGPFTAALYGAMPFPITFTTFTIFSGLPLTLVPAALPATCSACCTGTINATTIGGTAQYSYIWNPPVATGSVANNVCPGVYTICVSDLNGCTTCTTATVNFVPLGVTEYDKSPVKITYTKDEILITDALPIKEYFIYDLTGKIVFRKENEGQNEIHINKQNLNKGIYVISIEGIKRQSRLKIIID